MTGEERRKKLINMLEDSLSPIKGSGFAKELGVSRQVIVQDIALLRAQGLDLVGGPNGYKLIKEETGIKKVISTIHNDNVAMNKELLIIVENGGKVIDIVVEHEIYGELRANLYIETKEDIEKFMKKIEVVEPLSKITHGIHLHTISVEKIEDYEKIKEKLDLEGLLNR